MRALPELDEDVVLVLPGEPTAYERELRTLAEELGVAPRVRFLDWLPEGDLDGPYALSRAFVLPSLIEGFWTPPVGGDGARGACGMRERRRTLRGREATPHCCSDPQRQDEVTAAVRRLLEDRPLTECLANDRGKEFPWERTRRGDARRLPAGDCHARS